MPETAMQINSEIAKNEQIGPPRYLRVHAVPDFASFEKTVNRALLRSPPAADTRHIKTSLLNSKPVSHLLAFAILSGKPFQNFKLIFAWSPSDLGQKFRRRRAGEGNVRRSFIAN